MNTIILWRYIVLVVCIAVLRANSLSADCELTCGDLNGDQSVDFADVVLLVQFTHQAIDTAGGLGCADVDGYSGLTIRDLSVLIWYVSLGVNELNCDSIGPPYELLEDSLTRLRFNRVIPPGTSQVKVHLDIELGSPNMGVGIPMQFSVEGTAVQAISPNDSAGLSVGWTVASLKATPAAQVSASGLLGGYIDLDFGFVAPGKYALGDVTVTVEPSSVARSLDIDLIETPAGHNTPMAVNSSNLSASHVLVTPWIIELTGDVNNDRVVTSADIIGAINYVFKSGLTPYPHAASADCDCSGVVSAADAIVRVNYVFKSGPPMCSVGEDCIVTLSSWSCP